MKNDDFIIRFDLGSLLLTPPEGVKMPAIPGVEIKFDARVNAFRSRGMDYGRIIIFLRRHQLPYQDLACNFAALPELQGNFAFQPYPHQQNAFECWKKAGYSGVVALPTGGGKSFLAAMTINFLKRPTLIMVPTIDLVEQWHSMLGKIFNSEIGMLGGGEKNITPITVSTYDSAVLQMEFIGNRFALLVADECHHLPGPVNRLAAICAIAPYRLGLTATPEMTPESEITLTQLMGKLVCQISVNELEGKVLAPYDTEIIEVPLDPDEDELYREQREIYINFVKINNIQFNMHDGWRKFIALCSRSAVGRAAFKAYLEQRKIARGGKSKMRKVWEIIMRHRQSRIIVFTADNDMAYKLGKKFFLPVLTCQTKLKERKIFLEKFRSGEYPILITSKVLNEGVDVPEAEVAIVVSGSGSVREHVQRLGRVLRSSVGKRAILYELISANTNEIYTSLRRRSHEAYIKNT